LLQNYIFPKSLQGFPGKFFLFDQCRDRRAFLWFKEVMPSVYHPEKQAKEA